MIKRLLALILIIVISLGMCTSFSTEEDDAGPILSCRSYGELYLNKLVIKPHISNNIQTP